MVTSPAAAYTSIDPLSVGDGLDHCLGIEALLVGHASLAVQQILADSDLRPYRIWLSQTNCKHALRIIGQGGEHQQQSSPSELHAAPAGRNKMQKRLLYINLSVSLLQWCLTVAHLVQIVCQGQDDPGAYDCWGYGQMPDLWHRLMLCQHKFAAATVSCSAALS